MKASKLWKKLLAGILCASMLFQAMPAGVLASEEISTTQTEENTDSEKETETFLAVESEMETLSLTEPDSETEWAQEMDAVLPETQAVGETQTVGGTCSEDEGKDPEIPESETQAVGETQTAAETQTVEETPGEESITESDLLEGETQPPTSETQTKPDEDDDLIADYTKLKIDMEETYYYYGDTIYIFVRLRDCKLSKYDIVFNIDDAETSYLAGGLDGTAVEDTAKEGYYVITLNKADIKENTSNSHKLTVTLYEKGVYDKDSSDKDKGRLISKNHFFNTKEENIFLEKSDYFMGASDDTIEITVYNIKDDIRGMEISNYGETVASSGDNAPVKDTKTTDPRYEGYGGIGDGYILPRQILYKSTWTLNNLKNAIDLGSYNLQVIFNEGDVMDFANAVTISDKAIISNCTLGSDYDNTSPYLYLYIQGSGFDPSKIKYSFRIGSKDGTLLSSVPMNCKQVWSGYIMKFEKKGSNWPKAGEDVYIQMERGSYNFSKKEFVVPVKTGIYYAAYNPVLKVVETGVAADLTGKRTKFSIVGMDGKEQSASVKSQSGSLKYLVSDKGSLSAGKYKIKLVVDDNEKNAFKKEFEIDPEVANDTKWDAPEVISKNAERHYFYYYYYEEGITSNDASAVITGANGFSREAVVSASEWLKEGTGKGTCIKVVIPTQKLDIGKYRVEVFAKKNSIGSHAFEVVASESGKFVLDKYSITWVNDDIMQLYVKTPNCSEMDDFNIKITETGGKDITADLNASVINRYSDSVYIQITGLSRIKAFKEYYILLTHKEYGYPVRMDDMDKPYYEEGEKEKGRITQIEFNKGMPIKVTANNRVVGINLQYMTLPAEVKLYAPNDTDEIFSEPLRITAATEGDYYYFTKEFYNRLPNKDSLYDMVISDQDGWARTYPGVTIGYREDIIQNDFKVEITSDILFFGVAGKDTAVITVTGNIQTPTFESSDESIITVTQDVTEQGEKRNTAVVKTSEKTGRAVITVFADGLEKNIVVTATKEVDGIILDTSDKSMWVGDSYDIRVYTLPLGGEDNTHSMTFTSSDEKILYVKKLTDTTAKITAMGVGSATLRVSLDGTTHITSMSVTVSGIFSLEERRAKVAEVGIKDYIENVDRRLDYCELPKGWQWDDGEINPSASDDAKVQYYSATYSQEGYKSFSTRLPVAVTRVTGFNIEGRNLINRGKEEIFQVSYEYVGHDITIPEIAQRLAFNCVRVSSTSASEDSVELGDIAEIVSVDKNQVVIATNKDTSGGKVTFRYTVSIDNGMLEGTDMFSETFAVTVPAEDCVDDIVLTPIRSGSQNFAFTPASKLMELDVNEVEKAQGKYQVPISLKATINGKTAKNREYEWNTDDDSVAGFIKDKEGKLSTDKNGNVMLMIKSIGIAQISVTAKDEGAYTGTLTVNVMDYMPVLEEPVITVNKNSTSGTAFALQEQNGNTIKRIRVLEQDVESPNFFATLPSQGVSRLAVKENSPAKTYNKKMKSECKLEVETSKGGRYQYDITVVTEVNAPKASLKLKTKANLFYKDAEAVYTVSSKYEIESIKDVGSEEKIRFFGTYHKNSNTVSFNTNDTLSSETVGWFTSSNSPRLSTTLQIQFAGYSEPQYITIKVQTENKPPKYNATNLAMCPGISSGKVGIVDAKTKEKLKISSFTTEAALSKSISGMLEPVINKSGEIELAYWGNKNVSYTMRVKHNDWTQPVNVNGKITYVKSPENLALTLGSRQLILNRGTNTSDNGVNSIPVLVGNSDIKVTGIAYDGKAKTLIDSGALHFHFDVKKQQIDLGLVKDKQGSLNKGSYKLDLFATIMIGESPIAIKKAALTIQVVDENAAKVMMSSPKGKINLPERNATSIVYTPKVSGIESYVKSVAVTGDYQKYFTASLNEDNKVELKAKPGVEGMSSKTTYKVTIQSTLGNGYKVQTNVNVKPVNKLPKITLTPAKGNLYRTNSNKYTTYVSVQDSSLSAANIKSVMLDTKTVDSQNFSISNNLSRNGTISFALAGDKMKAKKGTYKLKCQIVFKDADAGAKPATLNVSITIK